MRADATGEPGLGTTSLRKGLAFRFVRQWHPRFQRHRCPLPTPLGEVGANRFHRNSARSHGCVSSPQRYRVSVAQLCRLFVTPWTAARQAPVHGSLQARTLEWVAMPSSRGSSRPRDRTPVSSVSSPALSGGFFTTSAPRSPSHPFLASLSQSHAWKSAEKPQPVSQQEQLAAGAPWDKAPIHCVSP